MSVQTWVKSYIVSAGRGGQLSPYVTVQITGAAECITSITRASAIITGASCVTAHKVTLIIIV